MTHVGLRVTTKRCDKSLIVRDNKINWFLYVTLISTNYKGTDINSLCKRTFKDSVPPKDTI